MELHLSRGSATRAKISKGFALLFVDKILIIVVVASLFCLFAHC